jgi:hypothetical protein
MTHLTCGYTAATVPSMKAIEISKAHRAALSSGAWDYDQAVTQVRLMRKDLGEAWAYMVPEVREAMVSQRCFSVVRGNHRASVDVRDMDLLLAGMRVASGLASPEEVL